MINKITAVFFLATALLLSPCDVFADRIVLKEGKTLTGKITSEDDQEVMIKLGGNMFLRVEKSKISTIVRTQPKQPQSSPLIIMEKKEPKPSVRKVSEGSSFSRDQKGGLTIEETSTVRISSVTIEALAEAKERSSQCFMVSRWDGAMNRDGIFKWNTLLLQATMTVTYPHWTVDVSSAEAQAWGKHLAHLEKYEKGHLELNRQFLRNAGEALLNVRAKNEANLTKESNQIWDKYQDRLQKQRRGYDRRFQDDLDKKNLR